jgi:hypothetical protein
MQVSPENIPQSYYSILAHPSEKYLTHPIVTAGDYS